MIYLRFTKYENLNHKSTDNVNHKQLEGLCAYDITNAVQEMIDNDYSEADAYKICAKKQAEFDNWHASNADYKYIIFLGDFIEYDRDNQCFTKERAVVAKPDSLVATGRLERGEYGYVCKEITIK